MIFHNLSNYDAHIIFQYIYKINSDKGTKVIAKSLEKYLAFFIGTLHFKDSYLFLNTSLEKLVANLKAKGRKEENMEILFKHTLAYFQEKWKHLSMDAFEMLTRKGIYPYEYMSSIDRFRETQLPPKEAYYNEITMKHISIDEYKFAHLIFNTFQLKNLGELHDLYMETDVFL